MAVSTDLFYFCVSIVYWPLAIFILRPLKIIEERTGLKVFSWIERSIQKSKEVFL